MLDDILKKFAKVLRRAEDTGIDEEEGSDIDIGLDEEVTDDTAKGGDDDDLEAGVGEEREAETTEITEIAERLNAIDNEIPRIDIAVNTVKKDIAEIRSELGKLDENLRDMMMLYEVVSNQINPFIGISKVTATSMEKLERLERDTDRNKESLEDVLVDIKLMTMKDLDIDSIVHEVLDEGG